MRASAVAAMLLLAVANASATPKTPYSSILGEWRGKYECGQGVTALTLTISSAPGHQLYALFDFGPLKENPLVPRGSYHMHGSFNADSGRLALKAGRWINQPDGYFTVDLDGYVSTSGNRITGVVPAAGCSVFDLTRSAALIG